VGPGAVGRHPRRGRWTIDGGSRIKGSTLILIPQPAQSTTAYQPTAAIKESRRRVTSEAKREESGSGTPAGARRARLAGKVEEILPLCRKGSRVAIVGSSACIHII
jgi:hypothetical protein